MKSNGDKVIFRDRVYSSPLLGPLVKYGAAIMCCQVKVIFNFDKLASLQILF